MEEQFILRFHMNCDKPPEHNTFNVVPHLKARCIFAFLNSFSLRMLFKQHQHIHWHVTGSLSKIQVDGENEHLAQLKTATAHCGLRL